MNHNSTESIIAAIKGLFANEHFEVKITTNSYDHYSKQQVPQYYACELIFIDENGQEHKTVFVKENDTNPVHINSSELPLCGCDVSATGRTIRTSLNKLHKLCKKMTIHKYGLYSR